MERDSSTAGAAGDSAGSAGAADVPGVGGTGAAGDLSAWERAWRGWWMDQLEEVARQVTAARAETASLSRDFSHWWGWADKEAGPVIRYLRGHNAEVPSRMAEWAGQAQEQAEIVEALAERVDALALVVNNRLDLLEAEVGQLQAAGEEMRRFVIVVAEKAGWQFVHGTPVLPADGDNEAA